MPEIRCPMCSQMNPEDLEECQFCQARLHLTTISSDSTPEPPTLSPSISQAPDNPIEPDNSDIPPWLARIRQLNQIDKESQQELEESWLSRVTEPEEDKPEPEPKDSSDWLGEMRKLGGFETPPTLEESHVKKVAEPDWLQRLNQDFSIEEESKNDLDSSDAGSTSLGSTPEIKEPARDPFLSEPASSWYPARENEQPKKDDKPGWEPYGTHPKTEDDELPDWINTLTDSEPEPAELAEKSGPATSSEWDAAPDLPLPDLTSTPADEAQPEKPTQPEPDSKSMQDWLTLLQTQAEAVPTLIEHSSLEVEAPDWLAEFSPGQDNEEITDEEETEEGEAELVPAVLPAWVQAMRPVETALPEPEAMREQEQVLEGSGPLSGLQGVLPPEKARVEYHPSSPYGVHLEVTENQRRYGQVLEDLIGSESQALPTPAEPEVVSYRTPRLVVTLVLLVALLFPLVTRTSLLPVADLYPLEMLGMRNVINALQPDQPVLVVVDYEPALSGEMESASSGVIDHLMAAGVRLTMVSTNATGTVLAERLLDRVTGQNASYQQAYLSGEKIALLGYIAGGPTGMANFAAAPRLAAPGLQLDGSSAWDNPALEGIQELQDFKAAFILTDSVETGRAWIEQIQSSLGEAPFLIVTSAQAAPALRPYLDGGQVSGLVSGLAGGAAYEQISQHAGLGTSLWSTFQFGVLIVTALILIGGLFYAINDTLTRRNAQEEA